MVCEVAEITHGPYWTPPGGDDMLRVRSWRPPVWGVTVWKLGWTGWQNVGSESGRINSNFGWRRWTSQCEGCVILTRGGLIQQGKKETESKKKEMFSWWLPDIIRLTGSVRWVTWARSLPSKANTSLGWGRSWQGMWICVAKHVSMKLSSAPESNRMDRGREVWSHETVPLIMTRGGDERIEEWLTNAPPVVGEPPLLVELDSAPVDVHSARSRRRDPGAGDVDAPAEWVSSSPAA